MDTITLRYKAPVLSALLVHGPSPLRISSQVGLSPLRIKQVITSDPDLLQMYQQRLVDIRAAVRAFIPDLERAAQYLGYERDDLDTYIRENPILQKEVNNYRLRNADIAEANLREALEKKEWAATQFVLATSAEGGRRGYGKVAVDIAAEAEALGHDPRELHNRLVQALAGLEALDEPEFSDEPEEVAEDHHLLGAGPGAELNVDAGNVG